MPFFLAGNVALLLLLAPFQAFAFSAGPGGCVGGTAASTGHPVQTTIPTFADQGYSLLIDGQVVTNPSAFPLQVGSTYVFAVQATGTPFKGALIRVEGVGALTAGENSALASVCTGTNIQGVGHSNSSPKTILSGFFEVDGGSSVTLDVTVVESFSVYSYQGYEFPVAAPTSMPVVAPTGRPVVAPTGRPVVAPVVAPTNRPVIAPTGRPVMAPVVAPTGTPVAAPVIAPTGTPVAAAPVIAPTGTPVAAPVVVPISTPVMAPVVVPTTMPVVATPIATPVAAPIAAPTMAPPVSDRCVRRRRRRRDV